MGSYTASVYNHQPRANNQVYSPSVPLSVYRDLAAELQTAQAALQEITRRNHILEQENQLLRQEIHKAVQGVLHLQNVVNSHPSRRKPHSGVKVGHHPHRQVPPRHKVQSRPPSAEIIAPMPEQILIEEEVPYYPHAQSQASEVNGWWLIIAILLIIFTAFGVGYLFVRPILQQYSR